MQLLDAETVRIGTWTVPDWAVGAVALAAAVAIALAAHHVVLLALRRALRSREQQWEGVVLRRLAGPTRLLIPLIVVQVMLPGLAWPLGLQEVLRHASGLGIIASVAWALVNLAGAGEEVVRRRYDIAVADNLAARRVRTQVTVVRQTVATIIWVLAAASMLATFPRARELGASLLASAGIAGIVVGFAARPALSNIIAGLQIAFTQPIRLDDVVVIEGQWGRIEEITSAFVVVKVWDERRLVVPLSQFIEKSFENWTRASAQILGAVMIHADVCVPVSELRAEVERFVHDHPKWDKRVCGVQVTEWTAAGLQVRALVSSSNSGDNFDLRCDLREHVAGVIAKRWPAGVSRTRVTLDGRRGERHALDGSPHAERAMR